MVLLSFLKIYILSSQKKFKRDGGGSYIKISLILQGYHNCAWQWMDSGHSSVLSAVLTTRVQKLVPASYNPYLY